MSEPKFVVQTHVGRIRTNNEDNAAAAPDQGLWVVADGMGGADGGEIASAIAVEVILAAVGGGAALSDAVSAAHAEIQNAAQDGRGKPGMGSTVVAARLAGSGYEVAWVGDSRAYLWDGEAVTQLTRDHSLVQELLDSGAITADEAAVHPNRSTITQALGILDLRQVRVARTEGELCAGDMLLLCSDGLTGEVADGEIAEILGQTNEIEERAGKLIDAALRNGGSDNVTVALIAAPARAKRRVRRATVRFDVRRLEQRLRRRGMALKLGLALGVLAAGALGFGVYWWRMGDPAPVTAPPAVSTAEQTTAAEPSETDAIEDLIQSQEGAPPAHASVPPLSPAEK